jgi:hypothetical protein
VNAKADAAVSQGDVDNAYLWITRVELGYRRRLLPHVPGLDITQLIVRGLEARKARERTLRSHGWACDPLRDVRKKWKLATILLM